MAIYFYEFLVRGREDGTVAWHVVQAADGTDSFGRPFHDERILSMEQAAAEGITLPSVIAAVNAAAMAELETARARVLVLEEAETELVSSRAEVEALKAQVASAVTALNAAQAEATSETETTETVPLSWWQKLTSALRS